MAGECEGAVEDDTGISVAVLAGIIMAVLASTASNLGVNVQKYSFIKESEERPGRERAYVKQYRWWIGMAMVIFGALGDFVAFALAPQTVVTPVGSFTLVTNVFFAHFWLGEELHKIDIIGTGLIVVGATVAVMFGDHSEKCFTLPELLSLYEQAGMVVYVVLVIVALVTMYWIVKHCEKLLKQPYTDVEDVVPQLDSLPRSSGPGLPRIESGAQLAVADPDQPLRDATKTASTSTSSKSRAPPPEYFKFGKIHPLCYAGLAGTFGAQTVTLAKSTAEILKTTFNGDNQFVYLLSYVIVLSMFGTIFLEQHWLASGLVHFDALYVVPVFQAFFIGVSVIGGAVYFQELSDISAVQAIMFPFGVVMCLGGVLMLSFRTMIPPDDEDEDALLLAAAAVPSSPTGNADTEPGVAVTPPGPDRSPGSSAGLPSGAEARDRAGSDGSNVTGGSWQPPPDTPNTAPVRGSIPADGDGRSVTSSSSDPLVTMKTILRDLAPEALGGERRSSLLKTEIPAMRPGESIDHFQARLGAARKTRRASASARPRASTQDTIRRRRTGLSVSPSRAHRLAVSAGSAGTAEEVGVLGVGVRRMSHLLTHAMLGMSPRLVNDRAFGGYVRRRSRAATLGASVADPLGLQQVVTGSPASAGAAPSPAQRPGPPARAAAVSADGVELTVVAHVEQAASTLVSGGTAGRVGGRVAGRAGGRASTGGSGRDVESRGSGLLAAVDATSDSGSSNDEPDADAPARGDDSSHGQD